MRYWQEENLTKDEEKEQLLVRNNCTRTWKVLPYYQIAFTLLNLFPPIVKILLRNLSRSTIEQSSPLSVAEEYEAVELISRMPRPETSVESDGNLDRGRMGLSPVWKFIFKRLRSDIHFRKMA